MTHNKTMKKPLLFIALFIVIIAQSQNIFKDDFMSLTVGTPLHGQGLWSHINDPANGGYGLGGCVPITSGQTCFSANLLSNNVSYLNYGTSSVTLEVAGQLDGIGHPISPVVTDGDLYVSMVLNVATAPDLATGVDFFRVVNGDTPFVCFRMIVVDNGSGAGFKIGIKKGPSNSPYVFTNDIYSYGIDNLVVLKYSHLADVADDVLNLYANPDYAAGEPASPTASTNTGTDQSDNIDRFAFRLNFNNVGTMPTGFAGLVSASKDWFGLGFVPLAVDQFKNKPLIILGNNVKKGSISITTDRDIADATMNIYTITGALIEKQSISLNTTTNDISINPITSTGVYVVELIENSGKKQVQKITIN